MSTLLNAWTVPRPVRKIGTSARLALSIMTGMDGPLLPATDCEIDDPHQRVSAKTATPPTTRRTVIRTKRRTSALGDRSWLFDINRFREGNDCQQDGRACGQRG